MFFNLFIDHGGKSLVSFFGQLSRDLDVSDPTAQSLLNLVRGSSHRSDVDDRIWLNRQLLDAALRQVVGRPCLKIASKGFDGIMVSDAGGKFKVTNEVRAGGLVRTALRSTDILMDRVWQIELEAFENSLNVLFFPISEVVVRSQDNTVPDPEIQRQVRRIRTDLDRFSALEVRSLVHHGYCVARKQCRTKNDFFKANLTMDPPWDPLARHATDLVRQPVDLNDPKNALSTSRVLQGASFRRIWKTLLDPRDWTTYVWVPLLICLAVSIPSYMYKQHQRTVSQQNVLTAIAETSAVYRQLLKLLSAGSHLEVTPMPYEKVESLLTFEFTGFEIVSDVRIFDLRGWADEKSDDRPDVYTRPAFGVQSGQSSVSYSKKK